LRLAHGHWSLHYTNLAISQIAHSYQFSDASHFSKMHREYYEITPAEARLNGPKDLDVESELDDGDIIGHILSGELFLLDDRLDNRLEKLASAAR